MDSFILRHTRFGQRGGSERLSSPKRELSIPRWPQDYFSRTTGPGLAKDHKGASCRVMPSSWAEQAKLAVR